MTAPRSAGQRLVRVADIGLAVVTIVVAVAFLAGVFYAVSRGAGWIIIPIAVIAAVTVIAIHYLEPKWEGYYRYGEGRRG